MKNFYFLLFAGLFLFHNMAQTNEDNLTLLTPEQKYINSWLGDLTDGNTTSLDFSVGGSAQFEYGLRLSDEFDSSYAQGFLTTIEASLDLNFSFYPESFSNLNPNRQYSGIYAEILLSDFRVVISNNAGIDFWDNYLIYDNFGNPYLPSESGDNMVVSAQSEDIESVYQNTILYTGVGITEPSVRALLHFTPHFYLQIANKPEIDNNLSTTLEREGEWAGVETENSGGISLVWYYPLLTMTASVISQHYYDYEDPENPDYRQDDEFGFSLEGEYFFGEYLRYNFYLSYLNFFSRENLDSFYFLTSRGTSTVDNLAAGGMALSYSPFELINLGFSGDFIYVIDADYDMGTDDTPDLVNVNGIIYDVRVDLPCYYSTDSALIFSAGTYHNGFSPLIFSAEDQNNDFPLDLQLSYFNRSDRWDINIFILAANCLDYQIEFENFFMQDFQNLMVGFESSFIVGDLNGLFFSPGLSVNYSIGRLATDGNNWIGMTKSYVTNWQDNILGGEIFLEFGFPQTLMTLRYANQQLIPNQKDVPFNQELRTQDLGIFTFTTEIFY